MIGLVRRLGNEGERAKLMNYGYKNAPHIAPKIGDEVECGLPGETAIVASISDDPASAFSNCSFSGRLHLNSPSTAVLVRSVDGKTYNGVLTGAAPKVDEAPDAKASG